MHNPPHPPQAYPSSKEARQRYEAFYHDIKLLKKNLRPLGLLTFPRGRVLLEWSYNITLAIVPAIAYFYANSLPAEIGLTFLAGIGLAGVGTASHSASHGASTSSKRLNHCLEYLGFGVIAGVAPSYWRFTHNRIHHKDTNIIHKDRDTDLMPWYALHQKNLENHGPLKKLYYKLQWIHFPFVVGLNGLDIQLSGIAHVASQVFRQKEPVKKYLADIFVIILHYTFWLGLFSRFFPLTDVLVLYFWKNYVAGYALFCIIAPTHFPREAIYFEKEGLQLDYYSRQVLSTINYSTGFFGSLLCNGIEYHIGHHLFPETSPAHSKRLGEEIKKLCDKHGLPYRTYNWPEIILKSYLNFFNPKPVDNSLLETILIEPQREQMSKSPKQALSKEV